MTEIQIQFWSMIMIQGVAAGADTAVYESLLREISFQKTSVEGRLNAMDKARQSSHTVMDKAAIIENSVKEVAKVLESSDDVVSKADKNSLLQKIIESIYPSETSGELTITFANFDDQTRLIATVAPDKPIELKVITGN